MDELSTEVVTFTFFAMTAYKFQPASNNPYLQLSQSDQEEMQLMNEERLLEGSADTILDLIDEDYSIKDSGSILPSGPDSANPTLLSRKQQTNSEI